MLVDFIYLIGSACFYFVPINFDGNRNYYILTGWILLYLLLNLYGAYKRNKINFFISPIFLSVIFTFLLQLGVLSNLLIYLIAGKTTYLQYTEILATETGWLPKVMYVTSWACFFYWKGYNSKIAYNFYNWLKRIPIYRRLLNSELSAQKIFVLAIFSYLLKAYLYSIGLFGRVLSEKYFVAGEGYKGIYYLRELGNISYVTFFLISILKFSSNTKTNRFMFYLSLVMELFFGFIYGARSTFIYPILLLLLANYYVKGKVNKLLLVTVLPFTLIASMTIVLAYKNFTVSQDFVKSKSIFEIYKTYKEYQKYAGESAIGESAILDASEMLITNTTFVQESAVLFRFTEKDPRSPKMRSKVLKNIALIPIDAVIPKFIQGDNNFPWGLWFKDEVVYHNIGLNYSLAFSPIGFLYMGGGIFLVVLFFWLYGLALKLAYCFMQEKSRLYLLVYFLLLVSVYNLDSIVSGVFINLIRVLLIFPFIFWILFGKARIIK